MVSKIDFATALAEESRNMSVSARTIEEAVAALALEPWRPEDTVAVVAMGASTHSGEALVATLTAAGRRCVNLTASDLALAPAGFQPADHYVIVSESGRSPEPTDAARGFTRGRRIGITNDPSAPLAEVVDHVVPLGGWSDSRVYSSGFVATLMAYAALVHRQLPEVEVVELSSVPHLVEQALRDLQPAAKQAAALLGSVVAVDLVARGASAAAAAEGALMVREGCRLPSASYDTYQYIHGPMEPLSGRVGLVVLGSERELPVVRQVLERGVPVVLVTQATDDLPVDDNLVVVPLDPSLQGIARAIVETVFLQQLTLEHTLLSGIDIDEFLFEQPDTKVGDDDV